MNLVWDKSLELSEQLFVGYCGMKPKSFHDMAKWFQSLKNLIRIKSITANLAILIFNNYYAITRVKPTAQTANLYMCAAGSIATCLCEGMHHEVDWVVIGGHVFKQEALYTAIEKITVTLSGHVLIPCHIWYINLVWNSGLGLTDDERTAAIDAINLYSQFPWIYDYPIDIFAVAIIFHTQVSRGRHPDTLQLIPVDLAYMYEAADILPLINEIHQHASYTHQALDKSLPNRIEPGVLKPIEVTGRERVLGKGVSGSVFVLHSDRGDVAVKNQITRCVSLDELVVMSTLKNTNIQESLGFTFKGDRTFILMELRKTTLDALIYSSHTPLEGAAASEAIWRDNLPTPFVTLTLPYRRHFAKQLLKGLAYIHSMGILHTDLKPPNILVTEDNVIKIADFGLAITFVAGPFDYPPRSRRVVTLPYRDINVLEATRDQTPITYSFDLDVWAMAVLLMEMEQGSVPFPAYNNNEIVEVINLINATLFPPTGDGYVILGVIKDAFFRRMIIQMLEYDRTLRISAQQAHDLI